MNQFTVLNLPQLIIYRTAAGSNPISAILHLLIAPKTVNNSRTSSRLLWLEGKVSTLVKLNNGRSGTLKRFQWKSSWISRVTQRIAKTRKKNNNQIVPYSLRRWWYVLTSEVKPKNFSFLRDFTPWRTSGTVSFVALLI